MARVEVIQQQCDRCKRVELVAIGPPKDKPDFEAHFGDKKLVYSDICSYCRSLLTNIWKEIEEWHKEVKQQFGAPPAVAPNTATPTMVPPDLSPPKPHSLAMAAKK